MNTTCDDVGNQHDWCMTCRPASRFKPCLEHFVKCQTKQHAKMNPRPNKRNSRPKPFVKIWLSCLMIPCPYACCIHRNELNMMRFKPMRHLRQKRNVELYGCEFLLRFLVRLPILLQGDHNKELASLLADLLCCYKRIVKPVSRLVIGNPNMRNCKTGNGHWKMERRILSWMNRQNTSSNILRVVNTRVLVVWVWMNKWIVDCYYSQNIKLLVY